MPEPKRELESEHFPTTSSEQQTDWQERPVSPLPLQAPGEPLSMQITWVSAAWELQTWTLGPEGVHGEGFLRALPSVRVRFAINNSYVY